MVTLPSLAILRHHGYSASFGALLVTRQFPVCPSPLACRYPQWLSWLLGGILLAGMYWHIPHCLVLSWLLGVILTTGYHAGLSASSWLLDAVLTTRRAHSRWSESVWPLAAIHLLDGPLVLSRPRGHRVPIKVPRRMYRQE